VSTGGAASQPGNGPDPGFLSSIGRASVSQENSPAGQRSAPLASSKCKRETFLQKLQVCQCTSPQKPPPSPFIPLPIIEVPFERIGMDLVGPLQKSARGHEHILVIMDYATRSPEAVPLRKATSKNIAKELFLLFSWVGIPKEILGECGKLPKHLSALSWRWSGSNCQEAESGNESQPRAIRRRGYKCNRKELRGRRDIPRPDYRFLWFFSPVGSSDL